MTTAIIGGGAAGMAAAITAAQQGQRVLVLERGRKPLKKLGVTGNGRGNLLNSGEPVYFGDTSFALAVLGQVDYAQLTAFFTALGVPLRQESEGRVYPAALLASAAVDALLLRAAQLGVTVAPLTQVTKITREPEGFRLDALRYADIAAEKGKGKGKGGAKDAPAPEIVTYHANRVIVAAGGAAAPVHGTDGSAYGLLTAFGHKQTPVSPALCALHTDKRRIAGLSGQRVRARLTLASAQGKVLRQTEGEALFGEDAVSGIAAMQLARFYQPGATVTLDLRPSLGEYPDAPQQDATETQLQAQLWALAQARQDCALADWLTGVFAAPVGRFLLREAGAGKPDKPMQQGTEADAKRLAHMICALTLPVTGTRDFAQAQVTAGGIATEDFDPLTLESRLCPGLYAAGEVLDVDGDCGGFNLMFAFAGGILAGRGAAR